jgi:hypothetical protein
MGRDDADIEHWHGALKKDNIVFFFLTQNPDLLRKNTGTNIPIKQERYMKNLGEDSRRCQHRALEARRRLHRSGELCQGQQPEVLQDRGHTGPTR